MLQPQVPSSRTLKIVEGSLPVPTRIEKISVVLDAAGRVMRTKCGVFQAGEVGKTSRIGLPPAKQRNAVLFDPLTVLVMSMVAA